MKKIIFIFLFSILFIPNVFAADRYWVGGSGNWSDTSHWSTSSGGSGGSSAPGTSDTAYLDANSGSATVTIDGTNPSIGSLDCTGFTGTLASSNSGYIYVYGTLFRLSPTMTFNINSGDSFYLYFEGGSGCSVVTNGKTLTCNVTFHRGGTVTLGDNFKTNKTIVHNNGTFNANNKNVTAANFNGSNATTRTLTMGSGTWTLTGTGTVWTTATTTNLTLNENTSTIAITDTSASSKTFAGGGETFRDLTITAGGSGAVIFTGANTFNAVTVNLPKTITLPASVTTTVSSFAAVGTPANPITLQSSSGGTAATLSDSAGTNHVYFNRITDITAAGGATWNAHNSTDVSGNSGWTFDSDTIILGDVILGDVTF